MTGPSKATKRKYAPYIKLPGDRNWTRARSSNGEFFTALYKKEAIKYYQTWLLSQYGSGQQRELRPIPTEVKRNDDVR